MYPFNVCFKFVGDGDGAIDSDNDDGQEACLKHTPRVEKTSLETFAIVFRVHTVGGRNLANKLRLVVYHIIHRVSYIPRGAGFLPSTVSYTFPRCGVMSHTTIIHHGDPQSTRIIGVSDGRFVFSFVGRYRKLCHLER